MLLLIAANGVFAAAEIALVSARRSALKAEAEQGSKRAAAVLRVAEDPSRFLAAIQAGITLIGFGASAVATASLAMPLARWLKAAGPAWVARISGGLAVMLVTLAVSYLTLVFGELAPKRVGLHRAEAVAKTVAGPIAVLQAVMAPLVWLLARSTDLVAAALGVPRGAVRPGVTEEEIKLLVTEQGTLLDEEKRMIHGILALGDTVAREVMVPRVDVAMLPEDVTVVEAVGLFQRTGFSRMPVHRGDPDSIVGVLLLKDLISEMTRGERLRRVGEIVRPAMFVPETKPILALLSDMRSAHTHLAIVVDEYGGTSGIITIEDIVEEIVGEIADEFDRDRRYVVPVRDGEWLVDAQLPVSDAREMLGVDLPESDEYDTVAGWVLAELGRIPAPGETIEGPGFTARVEAMRRRRISRLRISVRRGDAADVSASEQKEGGSDGREAVP
ncbi:hemolysin family protein [Coriobacteriia bacterium Es71-Z0120]|uniref:hemolysin family protein n=1 Tax=Parvivirga hydrogeniphila TaxID=2939460 RepID=UPI0022609C9A|nr:hemolysin family protein [Parvivirga hydrogeniphila]MCL4078220.1 hemolysin family protein [Parvivirga hydrogeniphila]